MIGQPIISVILLVFNSNKHLSYCIQSIINQTFKDFELIIVDDGSTDDTLLRCKNFAEKDFRIKIFSKKNEGIEKTRLYGVEKSEGRYLVFLDHDDWYSSDALQILYKTVIRTSAEIVVAKYGEVISERIPFTQKGFNKLPQMVVSHEEFITKYYSNFFGHNQFSVSTWGKIYDRTLFNNNLQILGFNPTEDVALNIQIFPLAEKIAFIDDIIYFHRFGGLTSKPNVRILLRNYESLYYLKQQYLKKFPFRNGKLFINIELKNIILHFIKTSLIYNQLSPEEISRNLQQFRLTNANEDFEEYYCKNFDNDYFLESFYINYTNNNWSEIIEKLKKQVREGKLKKYVKGYASHIISWVS